MSIYNNETNKIYPGHKSHKYITWKKLTEIETYLVDKTDAFDSLVKKKKQFNAITSVHRPNNISSHY